MSGKTTFTISADRPALFESMREMGGDFSHLGARIAECLLAGEVGFQDSIVMAMYGVDMKPLPQTPHAGDPQ